MASSQVLHNKFVSDTLKTYPELIKSKQWRMRNLYYIITKEGTKELFTPNRAQEHFMGMMDKYFRFIILKSRQLGFTTFLALWIFDEILFNKNKEGIVMAHTKNDAEKIFDRKVSYAKENLPDSVKFGINVTQDSAKKFKIKSKDGSFSTFMVTNSARSGTPHYVHASELAELIVKYPKKAVEFITGTLPAIPMNGRLFIESTANGMAGYFYDTFMSSLKLIDNFTPSMSRAIPYPIFYNWQWDDMDMAQLVDDIIPVELMDKNPDIDWVEYQATHNLSPVEMTYYYLKWLSLEKDVTKLMQQYPTTHEEAFGASGRTYFSNKKLFECKLNEVDAKRYNVKEEGEKIVLEEADLSDRMQGKLWLWDERKPGMRYVIGGDVAEGLADGDASVLAILEEITGAVVGFYICHDEPFEFAKMAFKVGKYFNSALLAVESNKDGLYVNDILLRDNYPNLYFREEQDDITKQISKQIGWKTTSVTRPYALTAFKTAFNNSDYWIQGPLLDEMLSFMLNRRGRAEALAGSHDDLVMATSIAYGVLENRRKFKKTTDTPKDNSLMAFMFGEITWDQLPEELKRSMGTSEYLEKLDNQ